MKNRFFAALAALSLLVVTMAEAGTVDVTLVDTGNAQFRNGSLAGLYNFLIDGKSVEAMCDDLLTGVSVGQSWQANLYSYADVQGGAATKFSGPTQYSQAGWLVSLLGSASPTAQADINEAVWKIFTPGYTPSTASALDLYNVATNGTRNGFNWSNWMFVLTPSPSSAGQEQLVVSAVPIPAAIWLFGSALLGTVAFRRNKV